jgi:sigma-B regulation protein RsbU (phosphoserine phosphatase)
MTRILVVEDDPGIALALRDSLNLEGYNVDVVTNGLTARQRASSERFDLVLLDVMIPGTNGFDVCRELRRLGIETPIIFLSARALEEDRVCGFEIGANDYVVKPFSSRELMARVRGLLRQADDTRDRRQTDNEIAAASAVQQRLFPRVPPSVSGLDYAGVCRPARRVSGDCFDFISLSGGRLGLLLADVCGKGMPAALLGASVQAAVRAYALATEATCGEVLAQTNRLLFDSITPDRYVTVFFGAYDPATRILEYANAGHYPPWMVRASSTLQLESLTTPVGMFPEIASRTRRIQLSGGDWLLISSDGIPEARAASDEEFGDQRLLELLGDAEVSTRLFCERVIDAVSTFTDHQPADDLTLIAARVLPIGEWCHRDREDTREPRIAT